MSTREHIRVIVAAAFLAVSTVGSVASAAPASTASDPTNGAFNVVVSPVTRNLEVRPGGSVSETLQIRNQNPKTEHLKVRVVKFGSQGQDGTPELLDTPENDQFTKWVSFSATHFNAEPNVWTPITVTVNPPKTAAFGYYYAVVFQRDTAPTNANKQINQLGAVASLILLDVQAPGAVRQANITEFSVNNRVTEFPPVLFKARIHNSGNVHVAPRGNIFVMRGDKTVAQLEVNQAEGNVLPKSNRSFQAAWSDGAPAYKIKTSGGKTVLDKQGQPETYLDWSNFNLSNLRMGKYRAKLLMVYNDGKKDVSTEAWLNFWIIPWRILAVFLVLLLLVIAGIWALIIRPLRRRMQPNRGHVNLR